MIPSHNWSHQLLQLTRNPPTDTNEDSIAITEKNLDNYLDEELRLPERRTPKPRVHYEFPDDHISYANRQGRCHTAKSVRMIKQAAHGVQSIRRKLKIRTQQHQCAKSLPISLSHKTIGGAKSSLSAYRSESKLLAPHGLARRSSTHD